LKTQEAEPSIWIKKLNKEIIYNESELQIRKVMLRSESYISTLMFKVISLRKQYDAVLKIL